MASPPVHQSSSLHRHITRLPSSSLVSDGLHHGGVSSAAVAEICVRTGRDRQLIDQIVKGLNELPLSTNKGSNDQTAEVSWHIAKSVDTETDWTIVETTRPAPPVAATSAGPDAKASPEAAQALATGASGEGDATEVLPLGKLLASCAPLLVFPPEVRKHRIVVHPKLEELLITPTAVLCVLEGDSPESSTKTDSTATAKQQVESETPRGRDYQSFLFILKETLRIASGRESRFIDSCERLQDQLSARLPVVQPEGIEVLQPHGIFDLEVHQDVEPAAEGRLFTVFYFCCCHSAVVATRQSPLWVAWRREVLSFAEGPSRLQRLQAMFDTRLNLTTSREHRRFFDNRQLTRCCRGAAPSHSENESAASAAITTTTPKQTDTPFGDSSLSMDVLNQARQSKGSLELPADIESSQSPSKVADIVNKEIEDTRLANLVRVHRLLSESVEEPATSPGEVDGTAVTKHDPRLEPFIDYFRDRFSKYGDRKATLLKSLPSLPAAPQSVTSLRQLAGLCCSYFGFHRVALPLGSTGPPNGWVYREWVPEVKKVNLIGTFNQWNRESHPLSLLNEEADGLSIESHVWATTLPDINGESQLAHQSKVKLAIEDPDGNKFDRLPAWANLVWLDHETSLSDAIVWTPSPCLKHEFVHPRPLKPAVPLIYEAYVGLSNGEEAFGSYAEFQKAVLPRIKGLGYNTLLLIGVPEHTLTTIGWHVTNFFAPMSRFGTPEEFKALIDAAHGLGLYVMMSVVHSHGCASSLVGLDEFNGADGGGYFKGGVAGRHPTWDARIFDLESLQVVRFLLSQLWWFNEEYRIDGFRFEGVTSLLYRHRGVGRYFGVQKDVSDYSRFFSYDSDVVGAAHLMLCNDLLHDTRFGGDCLTVAMDASETPTVARKVEQGGIGFDFHLSPAAGNQLAISAIHRWDVTKWNLDAVLSAIEGSATIEKRIAATETQNHSVRGKRSLKVAMFAWESLHTHVVGGVAPHVTELAAGLARLGHEVHVLVRATSQAKVHSFHYGVHYHECPFQLNSDFVAEIDAMCNSFVWHMGEIESSMGWRFDICHAHDWLAAKALVQAKQSGHIAIQTMHSTEYGRCGNMSYGGVSHRVSAIEREACHIADRVICVSGVLADEVCSLYHLHRAKIEVIYNGINAQQYDGFEEAGPIKARYGIQAMEPVFLFVGRMATQKGPDLLLAAIPDVLKCRGDTKFILVGDGYMLKDLTARARALGVEHACRFLGTKSGAELKSLFKACDAVVVPSRNEPFGIVVLEGWSARKPVVATTCGGPRNFVSPDHDGFLVDPNPGSIAWGLCQILSNFEHARWMGERGRVKAAFSFSWDHIAKQTQNIYFEQLNLVEAAYCVECEGGSSLASRLIGPDAMAVHMTLFDDDESVHRGLSLHKMLRLLTISFGANGYQNFVGNEFCQPGFVDVPRKGNPGFANFKRRWDLADHQDLKYKNSYVFDAALIWLAKALGWMQAPHQPATLRHEDDKVVAFERGSAVFIFNFHPLNSYEGYQVGHSFSDQSLQLIFDTDEGRFGGYDRLTPGHALAFPAGEACGTKPTSVKVYLPALSGLVFLPESSLKSFQLIPPDELLSADKFASSLMAAQTINSGC